MGASFQPRHKSLQLAAVYSSEDQAGMVKCNLHFFRIVFKFLVILLLLRSEHRAISHLLGCLSDSPPFFFVLCTCRVLNCLAFIAASL